MGREIREGEGPEKAVPKLMDLGERFPALRDGPLSFIRVPAENLLGISRINQTHAATDATELVGADYLRSILDDLNVHYELRDTDLLRIPQTGPVIVVCNHPFGAIDAVMVSDMLARQRKDYKILANYLVERIPKFRPMLISVDPFGGGNAARTNLRPMRDALQHLRNGGLLATFPSGTVSHFHWSKRGITDPPWSTHVATLIRKTGATVLPIHFSGRNSMLFQTAGTVHPLRTALIPRETAAKSGRTFRARIGNPIPYSSLKGFENDEQLIRFLRLNTYILGEPKTGAKAAKAKKHLARLRIRGKMKPVIDPVPPADLTADLDRLPASSLLVKQEDHEIYVATAAQAPAIIREIGRLREVTFREVGEGSGNPIDLDRFDDYYLHLFLWNAANRDIVGAYRVGLVDEILRERGKRGLYTSTLFKFKPAFLDNLEPAIELGRSFITSKYQRQHNSLSLLWKGIAAYLVRHPHYKIIFGPVSISQEYNKLSKRLLVQFMTEKLRHPSLAGFVKPSHKFKDMSMLGLARENISDSVRDINDVSALISEIEKDGKGIPVLLRQYLRMNSLLLSFNVDKKFSNVLDGLMMTDVTKTDRRILKRYFGQEALQSFLDYHDAPLDGQTASAKTR